MGKDKITNWLQWLFLGGIVGITCIFVYKNIKVIISYCNTNQGFFSALLGFLAILISVLTYYKQTKNAQENAKLQRELTEQNNKLQVDLQLRQIKLSSYDIKINYWKKILSCYQFVKQVNTINNLNTDKEFGDIVIQYHNEISTYPNNDIMLNELIFILDCNNELKQQIDFAQNGYENFCKVYKKLYEGYMFQSYMDGMCAIPKDEIDEKSLCDMLKIDVANLINLLPKIIEELEKHIDIRQVDKI